MSEDKRTTEEIITNDNSEIINKMYSTSTIPEKDNYKPEYSKVPRIKDDEESQKYIKEMHDLADKNEFKNNVIVLGLGVVIVSVILFSVLMNSSFMQPKAAEIAKEVKEVVQQTTVDSASTESVDKVDPVEQVKPENNIYEFLGEETNKASVLKKAIDLNNGSKTGLTVYLLSEILRSNAYDVPNETYTVKGLMEKLTSLGWKKNTDFNKLEKGDICFTTDLVGKPGIPSHTYIFMGWVEDGKTDYANIVDGQIEEFGNMLHKRNISVITPQKDKFSFFLRK